MRFALLCRRLRRRKFNLRLLLLLLVVEGVSLSGCAMLPASRFPAPLERADEASELVQNGIHFSLQRIEPGMPAQPESPAHAPVSEAPDADGAPQDYVVQAGDTLRVTVWDHPELNNPGLGALTSATGNAGVPGAETLRMGGASSLDAQARLVQPDGTLYFPYVGTVTVAGLDVPRIRTLLTRRLSAVIPAPQLDVAVVAFRSQRVYVAGAVRTPGAQPLTDVPITVADALAAAGGYVEGADLQSVSLNRGGKTRTLDLYAFFFQGDLTQNPRLRSGDVLNLPPRRDKKVFVLGEVAKPGSQVMPLGPMSLSEALADAGGLNPVSANAAQIYVFRAGDQPQQVKVYQLDAMNPGLLVLGDRFVLRPRDIVFVDPANLTRFSRVVSQILPLASSLYMTSAAANR